MGRKPKAGVSYLRTLREERDITLTEMVQKIGYTKGYVSAVETGVSRATGAFLRAYERALDLAPGSLSSLEVAPAASISTVISTVQAGFGRAPAEAEEQDSPRAPAPLRLEPAGAVLEGAQAILLHAIALVTSAARQPPLPGADIVITFQSGHDPLMIYPELANAWRASLRQALDAGWNIVHLWRLQGDTERRFELITKMLSLLGYRGRYQPYIFPSHTAPVAPSDLIIVPGQGALSLFGSRQAKYVDSGFFFPPESAHFTLLSQFAATMRSQTQPLLEAYPGRSLDFKTAALAVENEPGDQLLLKEGMGLQVLPPAIRAAYIQRILQAAGGRSDQEQMRLQLWCQTLLEQHTRRVQMFETYLREGTYTARHLVTKSAIRALVETGELPVDDWLRDEPQSRLMPDEVAAWLRHVVGLLETYPTYHLGVIESLADHEFPVYWKVEGYQTIILESWQRNDTGGERENVNILIHDPAIAQSFREHFLQLWERLPPEDKEKPAVIAWLNERIADLEAKPIDA